MYLKVSGVEKFFVNDQQEATRVLGPIDLAIEKGSFVSIVGPSGCGKSTLLYMIAGLEEVDQGQLTMNGKQIVRPGVDRVVVFQEAGLFPWMTILENVTYGLKIKKIAKQAAEKKAMEYLKMVHLSKYRDAYPHQLSGGMKQRVSIARALVMEPEVLLMDEPFSALDEQTRMVLHKELVDIWRKTGVTILFVTHNIREAVLLSEKVYVFGTRPGIIKAEIAIPRLTNGILPDQLTLQTEQRILTILQTEIEKVLKEELGDDYRFETELLHLDADHDMGSYI
ncbi:ABC transporter ATP-binding protein [Paenibacillus yanchengensis]|uniref:ABC transporter ATP-binding protein n=1 Tax=Paenibacillus yanchengensis TaxID=2035833 RepID=A0ABW4YNT1_9BACL